MTRVSSPLTSTKDTFNWDLHFSHKVDGDVARARTPFGNASRRRISGTPLRMSRSDNFGNSGARKSWILDKFRKGLSPCACALFFIKSAREEIVVRRMKNCLEVCFSSLVKDFAVFG